MKRYTFSRRVFVGFLASSVAAVIAACRGPESDTPDTADRESSATTIAQQDRGTPAPSVSRTPTLEATATTTATATATPSALEIPVWVDPALPEGLRPAAEQLREHLITTAGTELTMTETAERQNAAVVIEASTSDAPGKVVSREIEVPVVSPRLPHRTVTQADLEAALSGNLTDWSQLGSPVAIPIQPIALAGYEHGISAANAIPAANYDELAALLRQHRGGVALVPVNLVDFRVMSLVVDGVDPVSSHKAPDGYPFALQLVASGEGPRWEAAQPHLETAIAAVSSDASEPVTTVTMVGDIIMGRTVHTIMVAKNDFTAPFTLVADELTKADLTIANLECSLSDSITPPDDPLTFLFMTFSAGVQGLEISGIDGVSQSNNHSMNFGAQGMRDTLTTLDASGIKHFGIGETLAEARQPGIFEVNGLRIAYLGFDGITGHIDGATESSPGTSPLVYQHVVDDVTAATQVADIVIPFFHWGTEYVLVPSEDQREFARAAIDAGATMVVGSHCHWVQGMEVYQGKPIVYSLGNFVFDQEWSLETKQGLIMHLVFHGKRLAGLRFVPVLIEDYHRPRIVTDGEFLQIMDRVWVSSDELGSTV